MPPDWWYQRHANLSKTIAFYLWHGLVSSTRSMYSTGQKSYIGFVQLHSLLNPDGSLLPASETAILQWIASLGPRVQPKTIKKYLTHVKSMHTDLNLSFTATDSPIVQRVICGIKRFHGEKDRKPKQPITLPVLQDILAHLQPGIKPGHLVVYAACCVAFSGLLRCGEFTSKSADKAFSPSFQLSQASVQFLPNFDDTSHAILFLPASKTDPFCKAALKALFPNGTTSDPTIPLFPSPDDQSKPISHTFFISAIHEALSAAGYDPSLFAGHTFR
ncbi:hypothetical protein IW261DRAFT_1560355 [Armillaria novae-zelandiae]|uniref:Tyr recombinase domain-containing protein n=1 Tax=Armillaria novae-zelandiae TaxID=153914 RepID=A0AA39PIV7_9AGAR|nr:hypothetical protein IW261DRAFT_1560355 [Armillaria novae-zelandiae]